MRADIRSLATHFFLYVVFQILVLYKFVLFDSAFAFFYVGFLLLLPLSQTTMNAMTIGFFVGLLIDIFSNTPGIHASACVIICFLRLPWLSIVQGSSLEDSTKVSVHGLGLISFLTYVMPLVLLHHILIFVLENGSFLPFGLIAKRFVYSAILTSIIIFSSNYLIASKERRI